jgi:FtsH-binding integral membrane protein
MKKILSFIIAIFTCGLITTAAFPVADTYADGVSACEHSILGLRPWYSGLTKKDSKGNCVIAQPAQNDMAVFVWKIVLNVSADLALIVGYAAIIFVIFGGYKYIMSTGEPGKVSAAKQIITNALIGLIIAILATVIVNTLIAVIGGAATK